MKITGLRTRRIHIPFDKPIGTSIHRIEGVSGLLVWLDTDEGITGESYLWAIGQHRVPVLESIVRMLGERAIGKDPRDTTARFDEMWTEINFLGHKGVSLFGIAAIDWACWDILGQSLGASVSRLLGRRRDRVTAYASGGLWASMTIPELEAQARDFVAQGFTAVKMRIGKPDIGEDIERVAAVRSAIGSRIKLMADANQGLAVNHAIRLGRKLETFDLVWFEEPVQAYDLEGSARVAAEIDTPVASGETEYGRYGFRDMLERKSADVLMPDLERVGGVTEWVRVAHMAAAYDVPVSPHIFSEHSLQLCGAISNVNYAEHMPWFAELFQERLEMVDGDLLIPDRPGMGFRFDPDAVGRYADD
ncbi:mandelate racemase/muconate lactonizing enzyme family protein [Thalassobaculum sp.]|uniref:mandelate racemase/muconate lactonizing enzyme family protein n=1 Tax=Thalassobaculum sp. TaxID=2022740 RepID=UPI0032EA90BF